MQLCLLIALTLTYRKNASIIHISVYYAGTNLHPSEGRVTVGKCNMQYNTDSEAVAFIVYSYLIRPTPHSIKL